jgi:hypothetical protein
MNGKKKDINDGNTFVYSFLTLPLSISGSGGGRYGVYPSLLISSCCLVLTFMFVGFKKQLIYIQKQYQIGSQLIPSRQIQYYKSRYLHLELSARF